MKATKKHRFRWNIENKGLEWVTPLKILKYATSNCVYVYAILKGGKSF